MVNRESIKKCVELLKDAEKVVIGAGAGLSADAGLNYMDKEAFARDYPGLVKKGFNMKLELMGFYNWSPAEEWGYYAQHINEFRFLMPPHPVYTRLYGMVKDKDYFVLTSNVDGMFYKGGFPEEKVFTPQGDYALTQCFTPCTSETWPTKPIIEKILPNIDISTQTISNPSAVPKCPNCGDRVFPNVRGGNWFIEGPYKEGERRFKEWLTKIKDSKILLLEFGAGFNTPVVVRWPMTNITYNNKKSHLIRVNLLHPQVEKEIEDRAISFQCKTIEFMDAIWDELGY